MFRNFQILLAASPEDTRQAQKLGCKMAHMAYSVGPWLRLIRGSIGLSMRGGLMVLSDEKYDETPGDSTALGQEILRECIQRGFEGVVFDFEKPLDKNLEAMLFGLGDAFVRHDLKAYVYPRYAHCLPRAIVILSSALVSGDLRLKIQEAKQKHQGHTFALEMEKLCRDIRLPEASGQGQRISQSELEALTENRTVFFSQELCAHYFTYKDGESNTHFVIYDDARSLLQKMDVALRMGIFEGFLLYPEVVNIWPELETQP